MSARVILAFGDSNTHGASAIAPDGSWWRYGAETRWPTQLAEKLGPDYRVIEEGLPGRTTCFDDPIEGAHKNGLRVLPALLQTHAPLDLVILMLGTNDLKARFSLEAADIAKAMARLVQEIRALAVGPEGGDPALLIVAPAPIIEIGVPGPHMAGGAAKSQQLADFYARLAEQEGAYFFDAGSMAAVDPADGIHLTPEAHRTLADRFAEIIKGMGR
ncbi:SGNH/GDSL hydrolase family protein [Paracoccaceae bacterium GXU_MW_L88]